MLIITIPATELFDNKKQMFINIPETTLHLEHSLVSISKWESKWRKPFMSTSTKKTYAETVDYIKCMTITQNVNPNIYNGLTDKNIQDVNNYISNPMTATTFSNEPKGGKKEIITSELIYYWMVSLNIPMECQKWHLNRLLTLIRVCNVKNAPGKKMSRRETANRYAALNAARRKKLNTKG